MNDTPGDLSQVLTQRYADRTPAERVRMAASMFGTARALAHAAIRSQVQDATDGEIRRRLLRRLYADEFTEAQLADIAGSGQNPR